MISVSDGLSAFVVATPVGEKRDRRCNHEGRLNFVIPLHSSSASHVIKCLFLDKTQDDKEHEGMLIDQWVSLTEERNAILCPSSGSGVPGATMDLSLIHI